MTNTATTLRITTAKARNKEENKKVCKAYEYVNDDLGIEMVGAAARGGRFVFVKKPKNIKWKYVKAELSQNNFKTFGIFNYSLIIW